MTVQTDTIEEYTNAAGVTIEGLKIADGGLSKLNPCVFLVAPESSEYNTLSAALAAITDASDSKKYLVLVTGKIVETDTIIAKDFVDVFGFPGSSVTVTKTGAGHGFVFASLTACVWRNMTMNRAGAVTVNSVFGVHISGTTSENVVLDGCKITNTVTNGGAGTSCHGMVISDASAPVLRNCTVTGGNSSSSCTGITWANTSTPELIGCSFMGGNGGSSSAGGLIGGTAGGAVRDCRFTGGTGGGNVYGLHASGALTVKFSNCEFVSGMGGTFNAGLYSIATGARFENCTMRSRASVHSQGYGGYLDGNCSGEFLGCTFAGAPLGGIESHGLMIVSCQAITLFSNCSFLGGDASATCEGLHVQGASAPVFSNCTMRGGSGGIGCYHIFCGSASSARFTGCHTEIPKTSGLLSAITATTTKILHVTKPFQIASMTIQVNTAGGAGSTVSVGTTLGGTDIINTLAIDATGWQHPPLGAGTLTLMSANAPIYITISGTGSPSLTLAYCVEIAFASCRALELHSSEYARFENCSLISNCASDAVYIDSYALVSPLFRISNCHIEARPAAAGAMNAIKATGTINPAGVYLCTLVGGTTNITAAAGTANGTNVEL